MLTWLEGATQGRVTSTGAQQSMSVSKQQHIQHNTSSPGFAAAAAAALQDQRQATVEGNNKSIAHCHSHHCSCVYRCPNGHPYVIGDCGGATQAASCPECGARIGGTGHQLTSGNTQHQELDRLARQVGGSRF